MKNYIKHDPWRIIEEGFNDDLNRNSESVCSIGNGKGGQRANFEETFSGNTLQGSYVSGVYYPDKTRVGWWKNGYPEYFAKMLNAPSWIGIHVNIEGEELDLAKCKVDNFSRVLDMKRGVLERHFVATMQSGKRLEVNSTRFLSIVRDEIGAIKYTIKPLNFSAKATVISDVDADIVNQDSNYDEKFWVEIAKHVDDSVSVTAETKKTKFQVCTAVVTRFSVDTLGDETILREKYAAKKFKLQLKENEVVVINKYACITSTMYYTPDEIEAKTDAVLYEAVSAGFETLLAEQERAWDEKWKESDIIIDGDVAAQQGINASPMMGRDVNGPTSTVLSVASMGQEAFHDGALFNLRFDPHGVEGESGLNIIEGVIRTFFDHGGEHIQINVVDTETLRDAQKRPENHKGLMVRVAGYMAYFTELDESAQEAIISRTEHLKAGRTA